MARSLKMGELNLEHPSATMINAIVTYNPDSREDENAKIMNTLREKTNEIHYSCDKVYRRVVRGESLDNSDDVINAFSACVEYGLDKNTLYNQRSIGKVLEIIKASDNENNPEKPKSTIDKLYTRLSIILKLAEESLTFIDELTFIDVLKSECNMNELSVALENVIEPCFTLVNENNLKKLIFKKYEKKMNKKINLIKAILCCCEELIEKSHMLSESETDVTYKEISTLCAKFVKIVQDKVKTPEEYNKFSQIVKSELSTFLKTRAFENYEQNGFYYVGYIAYCYPDALIISFNYLRDSILESSPEFSLEDFSEIEMFVDPSKYAHSIMEATFKDYETLIEFVKFNPKTYRDDSERKEQAIKLCKKIEYKGEEWVLWEPQDRFLVQYLYACFVNTLKILNTQEFCECLDICSTVLAIINYVDLETYLLPEKSAVAEIIDRRLVDKYEADLDELDDKYCNGDFDEEDYDFQDTCYECYSTLVDYFKLDNNMSTCNRRYIIRKAYEFFVERTLIIPEDNFAKDFCLYSDNDSCDIINLFEHEKQTV